jgi:hypothetical protein
MTAVGKLIAARLIFLLVQFGVILLAVWLAASAALYALMVLPPEQFAGVIGKLPAAIVFPVLPFQKLWGWARAGSLEPGDSAPDFNLQSHDGATAVRLSAHRGVRPVVLVFGSYT